ncbi:COG1361 S-layer family protein [Halodesulfurarchaeum sp.]|uniref:COG1361 S-layer family protein n=1 Tax=Halodesulfurarchaeum sp. TaxID=1980530 RepID=UPI002FC3576E
MNHHTLIVLVVVFGVLFVPVAPAGAAEDPRFVTTVTEPTVNPGDTQSVTIHLENDAEDVDDEVETVYNVRATLSEGDLPFEVRSGTQFVGPLSDGDPTPVTFTIVTPEQINPGTYQLPIELDYEHDDEQKSTTVRATVRVPNQPYFSIEPIETSIQPGSTETTTVAVTNVGSETAVGAAVTLQGSDSVRIGDGTASTFLGEMAPNETRSFTVEASVGESVTTGEKPLQATFKFRNELGHQATPLQITGSLPVGDSQSFAVESVSDTLRVGFDGTISGELVNEGPKRVDDAVLVVEPRTDSLYVEDTRYALPSIGSGERMAFEYPTDVSGDADAGPRQLQFTVEYQDNDVIRTSSALSARVEIDPYRDAFTVDGVETALTAGESSTVVLQVTNQRSVTVQNIDSLVYTESPLEAPGDEAFIPELAPNESAEVTFEIEATSDARPVTYPIELDFEYETPDGSTDVSDTFQVPVDVAEPETEEGVGTQTLLIGGAVVLALIVGVVLWWRY